MSQTGMSDQARSRALETQGTSRSQDVAAREAAPDRQHQAAREHEQDSLAGAEYERADDWVYDDPASDYPSPRR